MLPVSIILLRYILTANMYSSVRVTVLMSPLMIQTLTSTYVQPT